MPRVANWRRRRCPACQRRWPASTKARTRSGTGSAQDRDLAQSLPRLRHLGQAAEEVRADGEDHPYRIDRIVGGTHDRFQEGAPSGLVDPSGVDLLQLVHEQQHVGCVGGCQLLQMEGEAPGCGGQLGSQRAFGFGTADLGRARSLVVGTARIGLDQARGQSTQGLPAGTQLEHHPRLVLAQAGDHAGAHERALACPGGSHHWQQWRLA
jgi:hypothetical protein